MCEKSLTYSAIQSFKTCRQQYKFKYEMGLVPVERPIYFDTGAAFHIALEGLYTGKKHDDIVSSVETYFNNNSPQSDDLDRLGKWDAEKRLTLALFDRYCEQYPLGHFRVMDVEKEFNVPIVNPETGYPCQIYRLSGKFDLLVKINDLYWLVEHKTTGRLDVLYKKQRLMDGQSILYLEAVERALNIKIQGVLYNVILKSVPRMPEVLKNGGLSRAKNANTTPELFRKAIKQYFFDEAEYTDYLAFLEANRRQYFWREYLTFTPEDLNQWRAELWDIQKDIRQCEINNRYYRNTQQCTNRGTCTYFDICSAIDKEAAIEIGYKRLEKVHVELAENGEVFDSF